MNKMFFTCVLGTLMILIIAVGCQPNVADPQPDQDSDAEALIAPTPDSASFPPFFSGDANSTFTFTSGNWVKEGCLLVENEATSGVTHGLRNGNQYQTAILKLHSPVKEFRLKAALTGINSSDSASYTVTVWSIRRAERLKTTFDAWGYGPGFENFRGPHAVLRYAEAIGLITVSENNMYEANLQLQPGQTSFEIPVLLPQKAREIAVEISSNHDDLMLELVEE